MKLNKLVIASLMTCLPALSQAENPVNYRVVGSGLAVQVCRAIVKDDVEGLLVALRSYGQTVVHRYGRNLPSGVSKDFTCNNMELSEFADSIGAQKVSSFFVDKAVDSHEQVAATTE